MEIREIKKLEDKNLDLFFNLAKNVYINDPIWNIEEESQIKQRLSFSKDKNSIQTWPYVVVNKENEPLARAVAILHPKAKDSIDNKIGWIGFFEALRNQKEAVKAIFNHCEETLRNNSVKEIITPKLDNLYQGLQINGFDLPHTFMTNYNPSYYLKYFKRHGYKKHRKITSIIFTRDTYRERHFQAEDVKVRLFDKSNLENEIKIYHNLTNSIFEGRYGYINRTLEESELLVKSLLPILDEELVIIAEDSHGNPLGYLICLPDINQQKKEGKVDRARIISIGVIPEYRRKKVAATMGILLMKNLLKKKYQSLEGSIIMKANIPPQRLAKKFGALPGREFVLLRKQI